MTAAWLPRVLSRWIFPVFSTGKRMFMSRARLLSLLALFALVLPLGARGEEVVTTTDGRQLLLRDNGSFQFLTGQQRQIPVNPYLSNTNPYLTNSNPYRAPYVAPVPGVAPVSRVAPPASPAAPRATTATEEKPKGLLGVLDGWIDEKKSKKSRIRK